MPKLIITSDIHGNYNAWLAVKALMNNGDALAVAGDLFDTRYGSTSNPAFDPEGIRTDLNDFPHPFYYVYGNCDTASFFPGYSDRLAFSYSGKQFCMGHGHRPFSCDKPADIVIQGHTHSAVLEEKDGVIRINPGSIPAPRKGRHTYGLFNGSKICLIEFSSGKELVSINI